MPVIVNELEIVVEAPEETPAEGPPPAAPAAQSLRAEHVNAVIDRRVRIALRTLAH